VLQGLKTGICGMNSRNVCTKQNKTSNKTPEFLIYL
jgi:hypothetical protein